jgi:hypothetical protein
MNLGPIVSAESARVVPLNTGAMWAHSPKLQTLTQEGVRVDTLRGLEIFARHARHSEGSRPPARAVPKRQDFAGFGD